MRGRRGAGAAWTCLQDAPVLSPNNSKESSSEYSQRPCVGRARGRVLLSGPRTPRGVAASASHEESEDERRGLVGATPPGPGRAWGI